MSQSHVSATIPWQEGTEEDFKDLREQLEKLRSLAPEYLGDSSDGEDDSSDDEDVEPGATRGILRKNINILYPCQAWTTPGRGCCGRPSTTGWRWRGSCWSCSRAWSPSGTRTSTPPSTGPPTATTTTCWVGDNAGNEPLRRLKFHNYEEGPS